MDDDVDNDTDIDAADGSAEAKEPRDVATDRPGFAGACVGLLALALALVAGAPLSVPTVDEVPAEVVEPPAPTRCSVTLAVALDEAAAAGAEAQLFAEDAVEGTPALTHVVTDPDGFAILSDLVPATYILIVNAPGARRWARYLDLETDVRVEVALRSPPAIMTGRILAATGAPIDGATITARRHAPDAVAIPWTTESGDDGTFEINTLHPGTYTVRIAYGGLEPITRQVFIRPDEPFNLQLALEATSIIAGQVFGVDGEPADGAKVVLAGSGVWPPRESTTSPDGTFRWPDIPPGIYEVRAYQGATVSPPREGLRLAPGAVQHVTLRLARGAVLVGTVVDAENDDPVENAEVIVSEHGIAMHPRVARTNAAGEFRVEGLMPRNHQVSVRASGYVADAPITASVSEPLEVRLRPGATVRGVVYDAYDRPVRNARVEVLGLEGIGLSTGARSFRSTLFERQLAGPLVAPAGELGVTMGAVPLLPTNGSAVLGITTDRDGAFELTGVSPGEIQVLVQHPRHAPVLSEPQRLRARETLELTLSMPRGGTIAGRVVDERGFPVGDVIVELRAEREHAPRMTLAGPDGTFEFLGALGIVTLTALPNGRNAARERLEVESGERVNVELALSATSDTLYGRVFDERDDPVSGVSISLRTLRSGTPHRSATRTGDDGTFTLAELPPPPYRVEADHPDFALVRVEPVTETASELRVTLPPGGKISGRLMDDWSREAIIGAEVTVLREDDVMSTTRTDANGHFGFERVPYGDYTVSFASADHLPGDAEASISGDRAGTRDADLETVWLSPGGRVEGHVLDALGRGVAGVRLAVSGRDPERSGPDGAFALTGLAPGYVTITATHPSAGNVSEEVSVRQAETTSDVVLRLPERRDAPSGESAVRGLSVGVAAQIGRRDGKVIVSATARGSRASRLLRVGDVITAVDGEDIFAASQARGALRGPLGVDVVVTVERRGRTRRVIVPRERYRF